MNDKQEARFRQIAEQFDNNFAISLRWLLDCSEGLFYKPEHELSAKIDILAEEVEKLKIRIDELTSKPKEEFIEIKASDGSIRGMRKK